MNVSPTRPHLLAAAVFAVALLTLCWPMVLGQYLVGAFSDQYVVGYAFRQFLAEHVRTTGEIPLWNPYIFGGLPFLGAGHGDVFYPTSWTRLLIGSDAGLNLTYAVHLFLAGFGTYLFLTTFRLPWIAAVSGGLVYAMSGPVASLVHPGHDGKLIVSAMLPLGLWTLTCAIRDGRRWGYAAWAGVVGLALLSPHPQLSYYMLIGSGIFTLYLVFWDADGPRGHRWPVPLALALAGVALGVGIALPQYMPMLDHIPYSPRSLTGSIFSGYQYAISFSMPPEELLNTLVPEFSGLVRDYWGRNPLKFHTEYLGVGAFVLATIGWGNRERRALWWGLASMAAVLFIVSLGGYTPVYRLFYEAFPGMKYFRAPSTAFFVVTFAVSAWAAFGVERIVRGDVPGSRTAWIWAGVLGAAVLLGVAGVWSAVGEAIAQSGPIPQRADIVDANRGNVVVGALRGAALAAALGGLLSLVARQKIPGVAGGAMLLAILVADYWMVERRFFVYSAPAEELYRRDAVIDSLAAQPKPFRALHPGGAYRDGALMLFGIQEVLGHHGNEISYYDELLGGKNRWQFLLNGQTGPKLWRELGVEFLVWPEPLDLDGWEGIEGPVATFSGASAYLYRASTPAPYARVVPGAVKLPDQQIVPTFYRSDFDPTRLLLIPNDIPHEPETLESVPEPAAEQATVTAWSPGRMTIELDPAPSRPTYVRVSEAFYPGWSARVDGLDAPVLRAQYALMAVPVPAGARRVELEFRSDSFGTAAALSILSLFVLGAWLTAESLRRRRKTNDA